ncbi:MAG: hypothetical protein JXA30_16050 [Deltaproteobacteria bacterium]|nr:hypothetical protein [Deltaproteobacteria bacterium]
MTILRRLLLLWLILGCGGGPRVAARSSRNEEDASVGSNRRNPESEEPTPSSPLAEVLTRPDAKQPAQSAAAPISRIALMEVLQEGIPHFLQNIEIKPEFREGRFFGWRVLSLFPNDERFDRSSVKISDIVVKVNGEPIERPEDLKEIWDSLASASILCFTIFRENRIYVIKHTVMD